MTMPNNLKDIVKITQLIALAEACEFVTSTEAGEEDGQFGEDCQRIVDSSRLIASLARDRIAELSYDFNRRGTGLRTPEQQPGTCAGAQLTLRTIDPYDTVANEGRN
jgi:hypothetical protein